MLGMNIILKIENLIINMNTLIKKYKNSEPFYYYYEKDYYWYNTNYDLIDSKGNIIVEKRKQDCFSSIFLGGGSEHKNIEFNKGIKLRIYALSQDVGLTELELKKYIKLLRSLGIKFSFKIKKDFDLNCYVYNNPQRTASIDCFPKQTVYIMEIKLDNINFTELKFLAYHFRFIYEKYNYEVIRKALKYKKLFRHYNIFNIISVLRSRHLIENPNKQLGHCLHKGLCPKYFTIKDIKKNIKDSEGLYELFFNKIGCFTHICNTGWGYFEDVSKLPFIKDNESLSNFYKRLCSDENVKIYKHE